MPEKLLKKALTCLPDRAPDSLKSFMKDFFHRLAGENLQSMTPEIMAQTVEMQWKMTARRTKNKPAINIYTTRLYDEEEIGIGYTIIDLVNDDMPFLIDSVVAEIGRYNRLIRFMVHPLLHARFDKSGKLLSIGTKRDEKTVSQSHIHIHLQGIMSQKEMDSLAQDLKRVLRDVHYATRDWKKMLEKVRENQKILNEAPGDIPDDDIEEYLHFMEYVHRGNFTLLGYREYVFSKSGKTKTIKEVKDSSYGLMTAAIKPRFLDGDKENDLPTKLMEIESKVPPLLIVKLNRISTIHRPVPLDLIAIKKYNKKKQVIGFNIFIGLFTSVTYSRSIQDVPILRTKAATILSRSRFDAEQHGFKVLRHILEKYPRDEFFQASTDELFATGMAISRLQERQRIALFTRNDIFGRFVSCLVYVPKERYDTRLRKAMQKILEKGLNGSCADYQVNLDDSALVRVLYFIQVPLDDFPVYNSKKMERQLQAAGRIWGEILSDELLKTNMEEQEVSALVQRYGEAFPVSYREEYQPRQAVYDIKKIEKTLESDKLALALYRERDGAENRIRLKLYHRGQPVILSDILPILENMGLRVISELPIEIRPDENKQSVYIHDFLMALPRNFTTDEVMEAKAHFEEALTKIWYDEMENDGLNRLILQINANWRDIMILRAYVRYLRQARYPFSRDFIERTLATHSSICNHLLNLFKTLFDPHNQKDVESHVAGHRVAFDHALEAVDSLEEDKVLRSLESLIHATLRTNFYQPDKDGNDKPYLSLKFDSRKIADLPDPKPYREIFVYSPRVEAVHLRGDKIARGGLRWSDRFEDFRTEILGLMRAQQVKNSLIVPMGSKGGFVVKKPPKEGGREAFIQEGIACYKLFIRGLLEITDNRKKGTIVPPKNVVRRDEDDPYLVVAADKGTATFSDIANSLSAEFDFWLGDAFASGGSAGYDHKKMGITARGAWESVKRHFRELNHNTQTQDFTVVGVGDMGGDVFGNGMLLSRHIKLIGAFNHLHIFCDPNPDPAKSFKERERMFKAVKGWDDYNTKLLSKGGRIYKRSDKSLELTPEIMKRFDINKKTVSPHELIQALLRARTDLLWFGGIGTYIKASHETHADVGDKANDYLRVNADMIRARVLAEGANLGVTQAARIEYARNGGRLNADFIDNSGGVNSSDLEVNIKILLYEHMADKNSKMTLNKRNKLLEEMTDNVAALVLQNNYHQSQGISLMEKKGPETLIDHDRFIDMLENKIGLHRAFEHLPSKEEIEKRKKEGKGLTRPEISLVQAYAKIKLTKDLLKTDIPDIPEMENYWLIGYFPEQLRKKYSDLIRHHRLRREIIATNLSTSVINRMGMTFVDNLANKTGAAWDDVIKAYIIVRDAFELDKMWQAIEALDNKVQAHVQLKAMLTIGEMIERETLWFLTRLGRPLDISRDIKSFRKNIKLLRENINDILPEALSALVKQRTTGNINDGLPEDLADQLALIPPLGAACDIALISIENKTDIIPAARIYFELGEAFHLHWLRKQARYMRNDDQRTGEALESLIENFYNAQAYLTVKIIRDMKKEIKQAQSGESIVNEWIKRHAPQAEHYEKLVKEVYEDGHIDLAELILIEQRLRHMQAR